MAELYRISVTKRQILSLGEEERSFFLLAGHTLNVISVWLKLGKLLANTEDQSELIRSANLIPIMTVTRSLIGAIFEANRWISRPKVNRILVENYLAKLPADAAGSYASLIEKYESGLIRNIRNSFSYHYPSDKLLDDAVRRVPDDDDWPFYLAQHVSNSFFHSSETVISYGLIGLESKDDVEAGFKNIIAMTSEVAASWQSFLIGLIQIIVQEHFPQSLNLEHKIIVSNLPHVNDMALGFLMDLSLRQSDGQPETENFTTSPPTA